MKLHSTKGNIEGYYCNQCSGYNDILRIHCIYCSEYRDYPINHYPFEVNAILNRAILIEYPIRSQMDNDKRVELHSKFYTEAGKIIEEMSYEQQIAWEEELEVIVIEAKAKMQRSSQERRTKQAKMTKEERDRLITNPDMSVAEGLIAPKLRKDRQSKADKMASDFAGMGIPADMINQLMNNIMPGKTAVSEVPEEKKTPTGKGFTFNKDDGSGESLPKPNGNGTTQVTLLNEVLSTIDFSRTELRFFEEKLATANLIFPKTKLESMPDKMIQLVSRIEELKSNDRRQEPESESFDPSKLFS